ncbi:MAG TPA: hypothetical protein PKH77_12695, partial [Anaerolineae bacterium]|nr:hypothetical protein [Anaerolineae bacterium]
SRLVTNKRQQIHANNQPAVAAGILAIHNGIITNVNDLWAQFPMLERQTQLDTEVLLCLIRKFYQDTGSLPESVRQTFQVIEGAASLAAFFEDLSGMLLVTNTGSLYLASAPSGHTHIFASENHILRTVIKDMRLQERLGALSIQHISAGTAYLISLDEMRLTPFTLTPGDKLPDIPLSPLANVLPIVDASPPEESGARRGRTPGEGPYVLSPAFVDEHPRNRDAIAHLRRCTRCVLPETMPFIEFDEEGVCNYCRHYEPIDFLGLEALREAVAPYRKTNGEPDCLVTFSGGRDSSYVVHVIKTVLGMNPVTYTYDWGMVTDLARRNQMRICGKLGIENILVSADLAKKRANIRKNVTAWLKKPDLGMVPLFMAGDKQYFYYANKVSEQVGVGITILGENLLETTRFKSGFCGIAPQHGTAHTYTLSAFNKARLAWYYGSRYVTNPAYLNSSLLDTIGAYISYYFIPHNYLNVYQYVPWDEQEITSTLIQEYHWETAPDTTTTWRIGDGTAAFYNYIYYTLAGFSENDTFRSNQIREGMVTRAAALRLIEQENAPRYESMQWYCDIIGIDFDEAIKRINAAPKLYPRA